MSEDVMAEGKYDVSKIFSSIDLTYYNIDKFVESCTGLCPVRQSVTHSLTGKVNVNVLLRK